MRRRSRVVKNKPIIENSSSESDSEAPSRKQRKSNTSPKPGNSKSDNLKYSSSSESDIENYLQKPHKIDLSSSFFNTRQKTETEFLNIEKGIFEGVATLSDSSESENELQETLHKGEETVGESIPSFTNENVGESKTNYALNFQQLENFTRKIEEAKKHVEKYNKKKQIERSQKVKNKMEPKTSESTDLDISDLLAIGESKQLNLDNIQEEDLHSSDFETSEDDWEEVKIKEVKEVKEKIPKEGIQITVGAMPEHCKKKKGVDLLAAMKRRLNRIRKDNQVYVHKVHLLCWIAHGNYINSVINDTKILGAALSLLPSNNCFPSDRTDLNYLEQIANWYKKAVHFEQKSIKKNIDLVKALEHQISKKIAFDYKMYVYIFLAILRALGIPSRLVISFQVEPLRPPASELHSLAKEKLNISKKVKKNISVATPSKDKTNISAASTSKNNRVIKKSGPNLKILSDKCSSDKTQERSHSINLSKQIVKEKKKSSSNNKINKKDVKEAGHDTSIKKKGSKVKVNGIENIESSSSNTSGIKVKQNDPKKEDKNEHHLHDNGNSKTRSKSTSGTKSEINSNVKTRSRSANDIKKRPTRSSNAKDLLQVDGVCDSDDEQYYKLIQLDGSNDVASSPKNKSKKPNLQKLKTPVKNSSIKMPKITPVNNSLIKKPLNALSSNNRSSEDEFQTSPIRSPMKRTLDVKNDIINLIKGRILEQKHVDRSRMVKKRKPVYEDSDSDSDYMPEPIKKKHHVSDSDIDYFVPKPKVKRRIPVKKDITGKKIISSESDLDESGKKKRKGVNVWVEVFLEAEEKWITVDVIKGQVHCVSEIYSRATHPVSYIVAWSNDNKVKDVTRRYCKSFGSVTRKLRVDTKWWEETLKPFMGKQTARDKEEDDDLNRQQLDQPMPKSISEYKNHPLYALRRHLLKFEAIYPPDLIPLGFVRGEAVYPRNCVYVCRSRDIWLKEAKVVKPGEKPYKIVKARPKYDKLSNQIITDQLLEIFGPWQTTDYEPPTAQNGIVPRNAFGNVELFKPCMLPKGTVHLQLPGLNKVCRKMNIDCASAIVGFDFHGGWSHPTYDGFVVCEEFADQVTAAWSIEQDELDRKENEKIEKRVYGNWKRLIRGLLIRERLKAKYNFEDVPSTSGKNKKVKLHKKKPASSDDSD